MAKKFRDLIKETMTAEQQAVAKAKTAQLLAEMPLNKLREARRLSQKSLADAMGTGQASVSKLERRADMYVSTLRGMIAAMGGTLDIVARFPDGAVRISQLGDVGSSQPAPAKRKR